MIKAIEFPSSNKLRELHLSARSYIKFSNNISAINVVSTLQDNQIDRSQLTKFNVGSNVKCIQPSCFINCLNLTQVNFRNDIDTIGDYAFYNCSSLTGSNVLESGQLARSIGSYAFARSGIQKVKFGAKNNTSTPGDMGTNTFASCYNLKEVAFNGDNIILDSMFEDCTALTSVSFGTRTLGMSPNAFKGCTSLTKLKLPADAYTVPSQFASGCTSLTSFEFEEPGSFSYEQAFQNYILDGAAITSITFPKSLTSLNAFSNYTLQGLDQLKEIHFNGISYSGLAGAAQVQEQQPEPTPDPSSSETAFEYEMNKFYCLDYMADNGLIKWGGVNTSIIVKKNPGEILNIMKKSIESNIPVIAFVSGPDFYSSGAPKCSHCQHMIQTSFSNQKFVDFINNNNRWMLFYIDPSTSTTPMNINGDKVSIQRLSGFFEGQYVRVEGYWENKNGKPKAIHAAQWSYMNYDIINNFAKNFNSSSSSDQQTPSQTPSQTVVVYANKTITGTNCFGLNHDVKIFGNDSKDKSIDFKRGASGGIVMYSQNVQVDNITEDDFRYGQWYGKAKLLKKYADENYIPVLAIATQGNGYKESMTFNNSVFNDSSFQEYVTAKSILLCKIDSSSYTGGDAAFLLNRWMEKGSFQHMPLLMMYWLKKDGLVSIQNNGATQRSDARFDNYAYFSSNQLDDKVDDAECVHDAQDVINWINSLTSYNQYVPQAKFNRPTIQSFLTRYPRYKMYANQPDDDYGRYFPVKKLNEAKASSYNVNVNSSTGNPVQYSISFSQSAGALPPPGTYQYFSLLSNDMTAGEYESAYQISGLIFKIGSKTSTDMIVNASYAYQAKTEAQCLAAIGVATSSVESSKQSFYTKLYVYDDDDEPTTQIDQTVASRLPFLWNVRKTLSLKAGTKVQSKDANVVHMWLSSEAQISTIHEIDDDGSEYDIHKLVPGNPQYVVSVDVMGDSLGQAQLLWIHEFNNDS